MLRYAIIFLIIAIVAGIFGFGGIAGTSAGIAKILFFVFLVIPYLFVLVGGEMEEGQWKVQKRDNFEFGCQ